MLNRADQLRDKLVKSFLMLEVWPFLLFFSPLDVTAFGQNCEVNTDSFQDNLKLNDTKVGVATLIADLDIGDESL